MKATLDSGSLLKVLKFKIAQITILDISDPIYPFGKFLSLAFRKFWGTPRIFVVDCGVVHERNLEFLRS